MGVRRREGGGQNALERVGSKGVQNRLFRAFFIHELPHRGLKLTLKRPPV